MTGRPVHPSAGMGSCHDPDNYRANSKHRRQTRNAGTIRLKQVKNMTLRLLEELKPENNPLSATLKQMERYKILTENLHAWFGSNHVLKDISIKIRENEATAIIGPSGCGKSTLIRCLRSEEHTSELQSHHELVCR